MHNVFKHFSVLRYATYQLLVCNFILRRFFKTQNITEGIQLFCISFRIAMILDINPLSVNRFYAIKKICDIIIKTVREYIQCTLHPCDSPRIATGNGKRQKFINESWRGCKVHEKLIWIL